MKEILASELVNNLYATDSYTNTAVKLANSINNYIPSHVTIVGNYTGVTPTGIPESAIGNWKLISKVQPIYFNNFDTWIKEISSQIKTNVYVVPLSITAPITIINSFNPCLSLTEILLTQNMIGNTYLKHVINGELISSSSELHFDIMLTIAESIINAIKIGFTVTPYASTLVGTGVTIFNSVIIN